MSSSSSRSSESAIDAWSERRTGSPSGSSSSSSAAGSSSSSSTDEDDSDTAAHSSSDSTDSIDDDARERAIDPEEEEHREYEAHLARIALKHVAVPHLDDALEHYATSLNKAVSDGRMTRPAVNALTDEQHDAAFKQIAKDNPHVARKAPERPPLPTVGRRRY